MGLCRHAYMELLLLMQQQLPLLLLQHSSVWHLQQGAVVTAAVVTAA
jgi:hypothetical protein